MAIIFSKAVGSVASFPDPTLPANISLRLENWGGFFGFKSVITRVMVNARGNYQFLHSLGGLVFVYVFGDRVGDLTLSGVAFDHSCYSNIGVLGIENVLNYYSANRLAARRTPVKLTLGAATTLGGYLLGVTADVRDPKSRMWEFSLHLALIPRDTDPYRGTTDFGSGSSSGDSSSSGSSSGSTASTSPSVPSPGAPLLTHGFVAPTTGPRIDLVRGGSFV